MNKSFRLRRLKQTGKEVLSFNNSKKKSVDKTKKPMKIVNNMRKNDWVPSEIFRNFNQPS